MNFDGPSLNVYCDHCGTWKSSLPVQVGVTMSRLRWMKFRLDVRFEVHWFRVHLSEAWKKARS